MASARLRQLYLIAAKLRGPCNTPSQHRDEHASQQCKQALSSGKPHRSMYASTESVTIFLASCARTASIPRGC